MNPPNMVTVGAQEVREDRYSRLGLIPWWDQNKIRENQNAGDRRWRSWQ